MPLDKEKAKAREKLWREKNKEYLKEKRHQYYLKNRQKEINRAYEWAENNNDRKKEYQKTDAYKNIQKQYRQTDAGKKTRRMSKWREYGVLNVDDIMYNNFINKTKCDVCSKVFESEYHKCLDHDHETGEFRFVLCRTCNNQDNWKHQNYSATFT